MMWVYNVVVVRRIGPRGGGFEEPAIPSTCNTGAEVVEGFKAGGTLMAPIQRVGGSSAGNQSDDLTKEHPWWKEGSNQQRQHDQSLMF